MKLKILSLVVVYSTLLALVCGVAFGMDVTLQWDGVPQATGYKLHLGTNSGEPYTNVINVGNVLEYTISVPDEKTYIAATAYDQYGRESDYSNEVVADPEAPGAPTITIKVIISTH